MSADTNTTSVEGIEDKGRIYYDVRDLLIASDGGYVSFTKDGIGYMEQHSAAEKIIGSPIPWPKGNGSTE
jgi:hypothetical protein